MSLGRTVLVALAASIGFVAGFYLGFFVLLSIVGLSDFEGWQFAPAALPAGALVAGLAGSAASPSARQVVIPVLSTALIATAVLLVALELVGGDFAVVIVSGWGVVATAITLSAVAVTRSTGSGAERRDPAS